MKDYVLFFAVAWLAVAMLIGFFVGGFVLVTEGSWWTFALGTLMLAWAFVSLFAGIVLVTRP